MATLKDQLQALRGLSENWDGYGAAAPQANAIALAEEFASLIEAMLRATTQDGAVLHVSPTRVGGVLIEWEDPLMQHEVDINSEGSIGFLHLNKSTGHIETRTFSPGLLQPGFLQELRQLLAA